ncbi:MAG: hypothetical protein OEV30_02405, partial [Ignavibacteria bacterium]|nr:hypothetical protein [Ignavibacteria bacterium]
MKTINLWPLDGIGEETLDFLRSELTRSLPFEVRTMRLYLEMSSFYDPERRQYNSTALLGHLRQHHLRVI